MKTELVEWLEEEIAFLEDKYKTLIEVGYYEALNNCLDFVQGAEVYFDWQQRQREKQNATN